MLSLKDCYGSGHASVIFPGYDVTARVTVPDSSVADVPVLRHIFNDRLCAFPIA